MTFMGFDFLDFLIGGTASICSTIVINPFEILKTRLQLQGELTPKNMYQKTYQGVTQSLSLIVRKEGWTALHKGLLPSICHQFVLSSWRTGISQGSLRNGWLYNDDGDIDFLRGMICGAASGAVGTFFSSPFYLIRTQMQAYSTSCIAVGAQHHYRNMFAAVRSIYHSNGIRGLWRGCFSGMPRGALGSGSQLTVVNKTKQWLYESDLVVQHTMNSFVASLLAGVVIAFSVTPTDVIATRSYNQSIDEKGKGLYYRGFVDAVSKIVTAEGLAGIYKGFWPNYWRLVPQYVLTMTILDELMRLKVQYVP